MLIPEVWSRAWSLCLTNAASDSVDQLDLGTDVWGTCNWRVLKPFSMTHVSKAGDECVQESPTELIKNADVISSRKWLKWQREATANTGTAEELLELLLHCWWECKTVQSLWKAVRQFPIRLNTYLLCDQAIPLLGIYSRNESICSHKDLCTSWRKDSLFSKWYWESGQLYAKEWN